MVASDDTNAKDRADKLDGCQSPFPVQVKIRTASAALPPWRRRSIPILLQILLSLATAPRESGAYCCRARGSGLAAAWSSRGGRTKAQASCSNDNMTSRRSEDVGIVEGKEGNKDKRVNGAIFLAGACKAPTRGHPAQTQSLSTRIGTHRPKATKTQEQKLVSNAIERRTGKIVHATSCRAS